MAETILISRYASRKFYNTNASEYVTLDDIADLIRNGHDIEIKDKKTKEDLTRQVLLQIIAERESHGDYLLPDKRKSALYGQGPARVETWYHQMKLEERYPSAAVELPAPEETEPPPAPSRIERIASAVRSYTGRRTRDRRPWLRYLRAHAGIPDITSSERDEAHRIAGERT